MSYETIICERRGAVALVDARRPIAVNAWTPRMASEQADAIGRANEDDNVGRS